MGVPATPPVPEYVPDFRPTHVVPRDGLPAWEAPDPGLPTVPLDAFLPVELLQRVGDWGQILCSNGWAAWVDARLLVSVPVDPPEARKPLARTADPRPLIARAEESLGRFRRASEELAAGRGDRDTFRRRTFGLRVGMVVDGESLWLYDGEHERWVYCDGTGLSTYAASSAPSTAAAVPTGEETGADHQPTRVVPQFDESDEGEQGTAEDHRKPPAGPPPPTRVVDASNPPGEEDHRKPPAGPPPPTQAMDASNPPGEEDHRKPPAGPPPPTQAMDASNPPGEEDHRKPPAGPPPPTQAMDASNPPGEEDHRKPPAGPPPPTRVVDASNLPGED